MSSPQNLSDDYVAQLLAQEATDSIRKYRAHGFAEVLPKRPTTNAPKPNTRFLRHVIKETDNHNAALRAKEAGQYRSEHELQERKANESNRRRADDRDHDTRRPRPHRLRSPHKRRRSRSWDRSRRSPEDTHTRKEARQDPDVRCSKDLSHHSTRAQSHRHRRHERERRREDHRERRCRSSPSRSRSPDASRRFRRRDRSQRSRGHSRERPSTRRRVRHSNAGVEEQFRAGSRERERADCDVVSSDSDPLESIVGPLLPPEPKVKSRGRGAPNAAGSGIDAHFAANYDPAADVEPELEGVRDDWDQALEALRDRQKWRERRADRLRAAGFSAEEVSQWASSQKRSSTVEKDEGDVRWRSKGEGREWDMGKVSTSDGETATEPTWGRLKNT